MAALLATRFEYRLDGAHRKSKGLGNSHPRHKYTGGSWPDKRSKTAAMNAARQGRGPPILTSTAAFRAARKAAREAERELALMQELFAEQHAIARVQAAAATTIQAIFRGWCIRHGTPAYTVTLRNCNSAEDVMPYAVAMHGSFRLMGCDGHGGKEVTKHIAALSPKTLASISAGPRAWVNERAKECRGMHSGGMITAASGFRRPDGNWELTTAWRGDAPLLIVRPDGSVWGKQDHIPFAFENDASHDPRALGYSTTPSRGPRWEMTEHCQIAISLRGEKAVYCRCATTGRLVATFTVIGDSGSFANIPTGEETIIVPPGSRIIWGSDGWSDVMHPEDPFFRQPDLTAKMVEDEAYARWKTRALPAVDLDKWRAGIPSTPFSPYPAGSLGLDDISVGVMYLY